MHLQTHLFMECFIVLFVLLFGRGVTADTFLEKLKYLKNHPPSYACSDIEVTDREGLITSPYYPSLYPSHISCSWHINGGPDDVISAVFEDVDIEESCTSISRPCCLLNWVKIGLLTNDTEQKVCGKNLQFLPVVSNSNKLLVKFHISKIVEGGRGFQLRYKITPRTISECSSNAMKCFTSHQCVLTSLRCNGFADCEDGSDELNCASPLLPDCKTNELKCGKNQCLPAHARCNGIPDCDDGSDEQYCSNRCASGRSCRSVFQCYDASKHCDGIADCSDFSDELDCGFCQENYVRCGSNSTQCYNPLTQRCDKIFHCINGEDEKDCFYMCPGKIMCNSRRGCYPIKHRCNGVAQCEDASDEKDCVPELCNYEHGGFLCKNGRCIQQVWTCDRTDDCGDRSDESNCLRNSVLTASVMGALICALLMVIAISCTCRLHVLQVLERRLSVRETPLSRLNREFHFREPPPSYAVAVQESQHRNLYVENFHYGAPVHRSRRRPHRSRPRPSGSAAPLLPSPQDSVIVNPDGSSVPQPETIMAAGATSHQSVPADPPPAYRPRSKSESVIPVSGGNSRLAKDKNANRSGDIQVNSNVQSSPESVTLETIVDFTADANSCPVQTESDHYYCDSDSEPLIA